MIAFLLVLLAAPDTSYVASLQSEARARSAQAGEPGAVRELQLDGALGGDASWSILHLFAAYQPRLRANDSGSIVEALHQGELLAQWNAAPGRTIRADQRGSFGRVDLSPVNATTQQIRLPSVQSAQLMRSTTEASWDEILSRRLRLVMTGAYEMGGGADAQAQRSVPLQRGPRASARATWDGSALDVIGLFLAGSTATYSSGGSVTTASAEMSLRHRFGRDASLEGTGGAGTASDAGSSLILPVGSVRAALDLPGQRLLLDSSVRAAPAADWLSAAVYERAEASAGVRYAPSQSVAFELRAGGASALTDLAGERGGTIDGQLSATVSLSRSLSAVAGTRGAVLRNPAPGEPQRQWLLFAALSFRAGGATPDRGVR